MMNLTIQNPSIEKDFFNIVQQKFDNNIELALKWFVFIHKNTENKPNFENQELDKMVGELS